MADPKGSKIGSRNDSTPNNPNDIYEDDGYVMGTNPDVLGNELAPIAVDQYFNQNVAKYPLKGIYQQGSSTSPRSASTSSPGIQKKVRTC